MNTQQAEQISGAPEIYRGALVKAYTGKSKAAGVKAKCLDCTNFQRLEITNCAVFGCPLHQYRPYQVKTSQPHKPTETQEE